jgi:hypothetical protein
MNLFYFVGGPVEGRQDAFFRRLAEVGGSPPGWRLYPHAGPDGRALHLVEATSAEEIEAHLAQFGSIYERGPIVEVVLRPVREGTTTQQEEAR